MDPYKHHLICSVFEWVIMTGPYMVGHYALMAVRLSVPCMTSRTEGHRKLKFDNKEANDTGDPWPHLEVKGQRSRSPGSLRPDRKISHVFGTGKPTDLNIIDGWSIRWPASPTCAVTSRVKGQGYTVTCQNSTYMYAPRSAPSDFETRTVYLWI